MTRSHVRGRSCLSRLASSAGGAFICLHIKFRFVAVIMFRGCNLILISLFARAGLAAGARIRRASAPAGGDEQRVMHLFSNASAEKMGKEKLETAFALAYGHFEKLFDNEVPCQF